MSQAVISLSHPFLGGLEANVFALQASAQRPEAVMDILFGVNKWKPNQFRLVYLKMRDDINGKDLVVEKRSLIENPLTYVGAALVGLGFFVGWKMK